MTTREIVAGGDDTDFMTVHHLTLTGSQEQIGRVLAEEARRSSDWRPTPADPTMSRARRTWFQHHWPQHYARLLGAAEAVGIDVERDEVHLDHLTGPPDGSGCSATWYASSATREGHSLVGRNYDFFTTGWQQLFAMMTGVPAPATERPAAANPHVITSVPDDGPATTVITQNELDGCMEGINEYGLSVVLLLADAETASAPVQAGPQVGLSPVQVPRFVLDTCRNVEDAKQALLQAKQWDLGVPMHYLISDPSGQAFVWEHSHGGVDNIVGANGESLCVTNHMLHRPTDPANPPKDTEASVLTHERLGKLNARAKAGPTSARELRDTLDEVRATAATAGPMPFRTLWRSIFDLDARTMTTHFYLGDTPEGEPRYSPEATFQPALG